MTALLAPLKPLRPKADLFRCAWCKCEGTEEDVRKIPGTRTFLCKTCWYWYCGVGKRREMCKGDDDAD